MYAKLRVAVDRRLSWRKRRGANRVSIGPHALNLSSLIRRGDPSLVRPHARSLREEGPNYGCHVQKNSSGDAKKTLVPLLLEETGEDGWQKGGACNYIP